MIHVLETLLSEFAMEVGGIFLILLLLCGLCGLILFAYGITKDYIMEDDIKTKDKDND